MVKRCVAYGCSNTSKLGYSLHIFPQSPRRRRVWEKFVQRRRANWRTTSTSCVYLCSAHFSDKQYYSGIESQFGLSKRAHLQSTAVPDVLDDKPSAAADGSARGALGPPAGASSARRASSAAVEKLNSRRIIAELMEDPNEQLDGNHVGVQTQQSVRNRGTQVTPVMVDMGVQCTLLSPEQTDSDTEEEEEEEEEDEEEEEEDEYDEDEEYFPTEEDLLEAESEDLEWEVHVPDEPPPPQEERKYIVFEAALLQLFALCIMCGGGQVKLNLETAGSFLRVTQFCTMCRHVRTWCSQPYIGNMPAGNLLMSAAILFAGAIPRQALRIFQTLKCQCISIRTFFRHQHNFLQSAIQRVWKMKHQHLLQTAQQPLILGGDGRADSPGHSAKFGSYTMMDLRTSRILSIHLVQSNEVDGGSNNMEKEGLIRAVAYLRTKGLEVATLVTDRHLQVAKWVRENMPATRHLYDIWHIDKGIKKKLLKLAREKECGVISGWIRAISNHLHWSATSTGEGQGELVAAKWSSLERHLHNVHAGHGELFPRCEHGRLARRQWLKPNTKASVKLSAIVSKPSLLRDIKKLSPKFQTSTLEGFHSLINHFAPKWASFSYCGMLTRLYLAVLHHNENCGRPQMVTRDGNKVYKLRCKKFMSTCTVQEVSQDCTFDYVTDLMVETIRRCEGGEEAAVIEIPPTLSSRFQRPNKDDAIAAHLRRFGRNDE